MEEDIYVEVAIPVAQYKTFTYKISFNLYQNLENKELIGRRVLVPFKKSGFSGIIIQRTTKPDYKVKDVEDIPDKEPVFTEDELKILKNLSEYYVSPIGLTINFFLPDVLNWKKKNGKWIKSIKEEKVYVPANINKTDISKLSDKALELLEFILDRGEVTRKEISELGFSLSSLNTLLKRGLIKEEKFLFREKRPENKKIIVSNIQILKKGYYIFSFEKTTERLKKHIKTISSLIKEKKDVLFVLPSVAEVKYIYDLLEKQFADKVFMYHDGIPGKKKLQIWFGLRKYSGIILVGTYSSTLVPFKNLGLVILEDEHSESYKALRTPRFDTRRVVFELGKYKKCSLIFSGTVSSIEAYFLCKSKTFKNLSKMNLPEIRSQVIPLDREKLLTEKIINEVNKHKTVLIIANKKAYASFLYCKRCEEEILCPDCQIPLKIYSKPEKYLKCELCNTRYHYVDICPTCGNDLAEIGFGIEKLEEILDKYFKGQVSYINQPQNTKIKLATTILDREFVTPEFDLVINFYPDFLLNINDFRGSEKFFKNVTISYFKAKHSYLLITNNIKNHSIKAINTKKPEIFYQKELKIRKEFELPPYVKLILLSFEKRNLKPEDIQKIFTDWIFESKINNINYKGPFYAYYAHIKGKNRIQILLRNFKEKEKLKLLYEKCSRKGIKLIIDVDPKQII